MEPGPDGTLSMRFLRFRDAILAAHKERRKQALEDRRVGDIVYSSADDTSEASRRDLEAFDQELGDGGAAIQRALPPEDDLSAYLGDPLKVAFRDDLELAHLQAEMKARAEGGRGG